MTAAGAHARLPFSAVVKPNGAACNLDCSYCYFLPKEALDGTRAQTMTDDVLDAFLSRYLDATPDGHVVIGWQGGEPTMRGLPFFRRAVERADQLRRPRQHVTHAIQTNGTLLDDRWGEFLAEHRFVVGISVDGPADLHDTNRVNRAGRGSHAAVVRGHDVLRRHGVDTSVLCAVNAVNGAHPLRVYRHLRDDLGARSLQFIPVVERATADLLGAAERGWRDEDGGRVLSAQVGDRVTSRSVPPRVWGDFLRTVFDEWVRCDTARVSVQQFDALAASRAGRYELCVHAPTCGTLPAVMHTGDVYACDHYVEPDRLLGNVAAATFSEMLTAPAQRAFGRSKRTGLSSTCRRCPVLGACWGGCPKDRFVPAPDGGAPQNYLCPGYRTFFEHAAPEVDALLSRSDRPGTTGRAPRPRSVD